MPPIFQPQPPTASRPPEPRYRISDLPGMNPDLIVNMPDTDDLKDIQFLCFKYAADKRRTNCWKILRVCKEFDGTFQDYVTTLKYPFGCASYDFNPSHIALLIEFGQWLDWQFDYSF